MNLKEGPKRTELGTEEDLQGPIQKEDLSEQSKTTKRQTRMIPFLGNSRTSKTNAQ